MKGLDMKKAKKEIYKQAGRKTKLTVDFIDVMKEIIDNYVYCTDYELVFLINENLPKEQNICYETFKSYKNKRTQTDNELIKEFEKLITKALIKQKIELLNELKKGESGWQSKAWILERKWNEWNLKQKIERETYNNSNVNIPIISWVDTDKEEIREINRMLEELC